MALPSPDKERNFRKIFYFARCQQACFKSSSKHTQTPQELVPASCRGWAPADFQAIMALLMRCASRLSSPLRLQAIRLASTAPTFHYEDIMSPKTANDVGISYRKLPSSEGLVTVKDGFTVVQPEALRLLSKQAMIDIAHLLRPAHLKQLSSILDDPEASDNDRFVAFQLLKNANIAAGMKLPGCQDTGTAIVMGKRGRRVMCDEDESSLSHGIYDAYTQRNLRYSQVGTPHVVYVHVRSTPKYHLSLANGLWTRKQ